MKGDYLMDSNIDKYSAKKEKKNEVKATPFDNKINKKDEYKLIKVDPDVHAKLKLEALKNNTTMREMVGSILKSYFSEQE